MPACPHDGTTLRYTDPNLQVRCVKCFDVLNDQAAGTPIGRLIDLEAPMTIGARTYPQPIETKYTHG